MSKRPNIWALVPAHDEQEIIVSTIQDLKRQSLPVNILVISDNSTDNTEAIVRSLLPKYRNLYLMKTVSNTSKKAGAVNQAIEVISHSQNNIDAIFLIDADTRVHYKAVEFGWKKLQSDSSLAAVCSKAGVLPYTENKIFEWLLHQLQRLEYSSFDSQRVETLGAIMVVHGMAALHRWVALSRVGGFDDNNLVEDYDLTLRYKEAGWKVTVELNMKAWTDVPVSFKDWWNQRLRWNRGGMDTLKQHGWNKATRVYILRHYWINFLLIFQWVFLVAFIVMIIKGTLIMHGIVLVLIVLSVLSNLYRLKYLEHAKLQDYIFRLIVLPEMIYGFLKTLNLYHSYFVFFTKRDQSW